MFKWRKSHIIMLCVLVPWPPNTLEAEGRFYFEELDRVEVGTTYISVYPKVTPDGRYVLVSIYTSSVSTINVYRLLPNGAGIDKKPVDIVHFDGLNNPFRLISSIQLVGNGENEPVRVYVYSWYFENETESLAKGKALISGFGMSMGGELSPISGAVAVLEGCGTPPLVVGRSLDIYDNLIFAITSNCIASINIHNDGSLSLKDHQVILPSTDEKNEGSRTLIYEPSTKQLFIALQSNVENEPLDKNIFLLIYAVDDDGTFNSTAPVYNLHFADNYQNLTTILAKPVEFGANVVMGAASTKEVDGKLMLFETVFSIDPQSKQAISSAPQVRMQDIVFAKSGERLFISSLVAKFETSGVGLSAYIILANGSVEHIPNSELNTTHSHGALELTPDGCQLIALAGGASVLKPQDPSYLVFYRINDPELNCTSSPSPLPLKLIISIPAVVFSVTGITLVTLLSCYLVRKYGTRKAYTPIN